tara:strand:- start:923 stop:1258 length:336 start_codon:yes stop_codon:yes gene_type:complete
MIYTQRQWDREVGWGKVPKEYREKEKPMHPYFRKQLGLEDEEMPKETKLEEYKRKINYDIWEDVAHVQGITFGRQQYNIKEVNVTFNMKDNEYVQTRTDKPTRSNDRNDKS